MEKKYTLDEEAARVAQSVRVFLPFLLLYEIVFFYLNINV